MWGTQSKTMRPCAAQCWCNVHGVLGASGKAAALRYLEKHTRWLRDAEYQEIVNTLELMVPDRVSTVFTLVEGNK